MPALQVWAVWGGEGYTRNGDNTVIIIYKNKNDIPEDIEYVELNEIFFNQKTVMKLDDRTKEIIEKVDGIDKVQ